MAKVTRKRPRTASAILHEPQEDPQDPQEEEEVSDSDQSMDVLKSLVSEQQEVLSGIITRLGDFEDSTADLTRKLGLLSTQIGNVTSPGDRDLPSQVVAGLSPGELYSSVISGCLIGVFTHSRSLQSLKDPAYQKLVISIAMSVGDSFLQELNERVGTSIDDQLSDIPS